MTDEVIKAMQGKKEHKIRKWWSKNGYKIFRVILFPFWIGSILLKKSVFGLTVKKSGAKNVPPKF